MVQQKKRKSTKRDTVVIASRVDADFVEALHSLAEQERRTLANMIDVMLRESAKARGVKL